MRALLIAMLLSATANAQMVPRPVLPTAPDATVDPFPFRRIALAADSLPPASAGPMIAMPLAEFNARLQAANTAAPRILSAALTATLEGNDLVGEGTLHIAATPPAMIALEPLTIALVEPKWKSGTAAVLDRTTTGTRLRIDAGSGEDFLFRWSARGREEPGILRYDLRLPKTAIAALELDLPIGRTVSAGDALVAGPLPSPKPKLSLWRIAFGGKSKLEIAVSNPAAASAAASFNRSAKYDLATNSAAFEFEIEALRGPVAAWTFRVDPEVRVLDVITPNRDTWQFDEARRELTVTLREPASLGRAIITTAVAIPQSGPPWPCAGVHGVGASGDNSIELRVGADPRLEAWESGDYTLTRIAPLAERGYTILLSGSCRTAPTARKPPTLTLRPTQPATTAHVALDWQLSPTVNRLSARVRFAVQHGPVTQVSLKLPSGYTPGTVRFSPDDTAASVVATATMLTLEPSRPWTTGQTVEARLELRGTPLDPAKPVSIPRLEPAAPTAFDGMLTVTLDPALRFSDRAGQTLQQPISSRNRDTALEILRSPAAAVPVPALASTVAWNVDSSAVATIDEAGMIRVQLTGTIRSAGAAHLPIALPADAVLQWAMVNGKYVDPAHDGNRLRLPVSVAGGDTFEVQYRRPASLRGVGAQRPDVAPSVLGQPVDAEGIRGGTHRYLPAGSALLHRGTLAILAVPLLLIVIVIVRMLRRSRRITGIAAFLIAGSLCGQPAETPTVYIRDADAMVFAPQAFFDRLVKLRNIDRPALTFTSAAITGSADETHATFEITLTAFSDGSQEQIITLPIQGIALESVNLDGVAAFPISVGSRFTLPVPGPGAHTIIVRGRVPLAVRGTDREATLQLDPLPTARLTMTLSPLARSVRVPNREGLFRSERKLTRTTIEADLGSASPVIVRWRSGGLIDQPARMTAASATLWDLAAGESAVTAAFNVRIDEGSPGRLAFEIPANLEPGRLSIRTADGTAIGIRDGKLTANTNGSRTYAVLLQEPLEGACSIILRLVPLVPLSATPQLTAVKLAGVRETDNFLLSRTAIPVERWERSGLRECQADAVARELGSVPELALDRSPLHACRREGTGDCWLRPILRPAGLPQPLAEDLAWKFGERATIEASVRYAKDANPAAVEFEVPVAVILSDVIAPDLIDWSRTGSRVRAWFRTPPKDATLKWHGTWPMPKLPATIELPQPPRTVPYRIVRLRADDKFAVQVVPGSGWRGAVTLTPGEIALVAPVTAAPLKVRIEAR